MTSLIIGLVAAINVEKLIGLIVLLASVAVAASVWLHGDIPLAIMVALGQIHGHIQHHAHSAAEEAGHVVVHRAIK